MQLECVTREEASLLAMALFSLHPDQSQCTGLPVNEAWREKEREAQKLLYSQSFSGHTLREMKREAGLSKTHMHPICH